MLTLKSKRILLVDDNEAFLNALKSALEQTGATIKTANGGRIAQQIIGLEDFDAIVSDINMPEVNGIELTHYVKRTKPTPVILTTGFAELKETEEAHEVGADAFLAKPFTKEDLLDILRKYLKLEDIQSESSEDTASKDLEFCPISIDDFVSGRQIRYNIFIRLSQGNFVKVAHQGEDLSTDRIRAYKNKNIHFLYLQKDDFRKYVGFNLSLVPLVQSSGAIEKRRKLEFLKHTNEIILTQMMADGVDKDTFEAASVSVNGMVSLVSDHKDLIQMLSSVQAERGYLYSHCVAVSLYGVMIARQIGWTSPMTLFKVAMGGLLHDIGMREIDPSIVDKPRNELTVDQIHALETHPVRGMDILSRVPSIPDDVIQITYQHHEDCLGLGFPLGLNRSRIHPMAKLIAVAETFCTIWGRSPSEKIPALDAVKRTVSLYGDRLDLAFQGGLMRLFGLDPQAPPRSSF